MTVKSIRIHDADNDGVGLYGYGEGGGFVINSTNAMMQSASHIVNANHGWDTIGAKIQSNGFVTTLPANFQDDNADIVNTGALEVEWIGTGIGQEVRSPVSFGLEDGDSITYGAWVYVQSSTITSLGLELRVYDSFGSYVNAVQTVEVPITTNEWVLVTGTTTVAEPTSVEARMVLSAWGSTQSIGDKMWVGMAFANVNAPDGLPRPSTLFDQRFKITARLQMIGGLANSGTVIGSAGSLGGWSLFNSYGFGYNLHSWAFYRDGGTRFVSPGTFEFDVERVYDIEFVFEPSTGDWELYIYDRAEKILVDSGTGGPFTAPIEWGGYGLKILPDHWGTLFELTLYDPADNPALHVPLEDKSMFTDGVMADGTTVTATQVASQKNPMIIDQDMFEISRSWNSGVPEFTILKSDYGTLDFSGDIFVACAVQTRNDASLDIIKSQSATDGWSISSVAASSPQQHWRAVYRDGGAEIIQNIPTVINDGSYHYLGFQRDAGVDYRAYSDDFETPAQITADTHTSLDGASLVEFLQQWQGAAGAVVIFQRTLTDDERAELGSWMASGAQYDGTPAFVTSGAVVHFNPSAPIQKSAINDKKLINLAHRPHDTLYVRYGLTSTDGIANPTLDLVHLEIPNASQGSHTPWGDVFIQGDVAEHATGPLDWQRGWLVEKGNTHNIKAQFSPNEIELDTMDTTFMICFTKTTNNVTATDDEENIINDKYWRFFYDNGTSELCFFHDGVTIRRAATLTVGETYLVALKILAGTIQISVNAVNLPSGADNFAGIEAGGVEFGGSGNKRMHAVIHFTAIFDRGLRLEEEAEIMSVLESSVDFSESITISNTFDYAELNWG